MSKICMIWLINKPDKICKATGEKRIIMAKESVKNVTAHLRLPVIIFHEEMTDEIKKEFLDIYPEISFIEVDFQNNNLPHNKSISKAGKGYMMMCRFFSGVMQQNPALKEYDYYMRFDDDSFLLEPYIEQEKFLDTATNSYYVYRTTFKDNAEYINSPTGLFKFTYNFCKKNVLDIDELMPALKQIGFIENDMYTGLAPYNNFHFSRLDLWNNTIIKKYKDKIIEMNGTLLYNWMDANIHSMIIFVLCPLLYTPVSEITDFGYRHNRHFSLINSLKWVHVEDEEFYPKS